MHNPLVILASTILMICLTLLLVIATAALLFGDSFVQWAITEITNAVQGWFSSAK